MPPSFIALSIAWITDPHTIFYPEEDLTFSSLCWDGSYFKGLLSAFCDTVSKWFTFVVMDHGAYPFGRSPKKGALAALCRLMGITTKSGTFNCCCFIHLLVAFLDLNLFSIKDLYTSYEPLLRKYMFSRESRFYDAVINDVLLSLNLSEKVGIRIIFRSLEKVVQLSPYYFGNPQGIEIFLVHDREKKHFFLAKRYSPHETFVSNVLPSGSDVQGTLSNPHFQAEVSSPPRVRLEDAYSDMLEDLDEDMVEDPFEDSDEPTDFSVSASEPYW